MKRTFTVAMFWSGRDGKSCAATLRRCLWAGVALILEQAFTAEVAQAQTSPRERISFHADWRFTKNDPNGAAGKLGYSDIKDWVTATGGAFTKDPNLASKERPAGNLGAEVAYTQPGFADQGWRPVTVPHDWGIEGPFQQELSGGTGRLPWAGVAWYRKHFQVPARDQGRQLYLDIDGAMAYANVWLNGQYVGGWPYGYASWRVDLTPYVKFGGENVIAIRLDNPANSSRWYPGGGIYRNVWLVKTAPVHVAQWGVYVTTPEVAKAKDHAQVNVQVTVDNRSGTAADVTVRAALYTLPQRGKAIGASEQVRLPVAAGASGTVALTAPINAKPVLWTLQKPSLYAAVVMVEQGGKIVDSYETTFGVRTIQFDPEKGFLLNGERVNFQGVCDHHDLGALGTAVNLRALERQIELLKERGCNAIRTSHNPPAPELLDLCDRMGLVVMDEAFDCWSRGKTRNDYSLLFADWHEKDMRALVRRDRNHPCVVLWSIGNEIPEQGDSRSDKAMAQRLVDICHREDPSRPTTSASDKISASLKNGFAEALDVLGINYHMENYGPLKGEFKLIASESRSTKSSRGEYGLVEQDGAVAINPQGKGQLTAYDVDDGRDINAEFKLKTLAATPWVAGEFLWTGFDYIGEPVPFGWPSVSSYFGLIDLCGFPKDRFYLHQSRWSDKPMAHLLPHWNWPQFAGKAIPVWCYSNAETVELFLNGKSLGIRTMSNLVVKAPLLVKKEAKPGRKSLASRPSGWYHAEWMVSYEPGTLKVVARTGGKVVATDEVTTAGNPARIELSVDRKGIKATAQDLAYVTVRILDADGHLCPDAENLVKFSLTGPGKITGVGNGNAICHEDLQASQRTAFHGLCLAVLQSTREPGELKLTAAADGLTSATLGVQVFKETP